jgi:hypothetical protein
MNMQSVAEIGHLIIKSSERFQLEISVGVGNGEPQIWFIPDNSNEDKELEDDSDTMKKITEKTSRRLPDVENCIMSLFPHRMIRK